MRLIRPTNITDTELTSSNVAMDDHLEWDSGSTPYSEGAVVMVTTTANGASEATFKIYRSNAGSNNEDPTLRTTFLDGDDQPVFWWKQVSSVNRFKMFDQIVQDQTENDDFIIVEIEPGQIVNALALINLDANTVRIEVEADPEGVVFDETFQLLVDDGIDNWWDYFNSPIERDRNIVVFDLPGFTGAKIKITIEQDGAVARCGALAIGLQEVIGVSQYFPTFGIRTFSRKATDEDFRTEIERRGSSQRQEFPVKIETRRRGEVRRILEDVLDVPVVYVGDEDNPVYGFYQDFEIIVPGPKNSDCSLFIEAL